MRIEVIRLRLCSRISCAKRLRNTASEISNRKLNKQTFETPYEYFKILAGTPKPFRRHQGYHGKLLAISQSELRITESI
jgi:hypothetical protein